MLERSQQNTDTGAQPERAFQLIDFPSGNTATRRQRLLSHEPTPTLTPSTATTASQQTTWTPPVSATRQTPQPSFSQDFDLFAAPQPTPSRAAPSLDPTLPLSFNTTHAGVSASASEQHVNGINLNSQAAHLSPQRNNKNISAQQHRQARPPVPLFDSNTVDMGAHGINVAYDGTFADLAGDAVLFDSSSDFDFTQYFGSNDAPAFTAVNGNTGTISPKDLYADSVPPSTSFTNLTTPGSTFLDTPDDDYQTSPMLFNNDGTVENSESWYSLFPDQDASPALGADMTRTPSGNVVTVHPGGEAPRKRSSITNSPAGFNSPALKHSNVAGVNARKRDKPLPPIMVDESDPVALKRARNTAAARKSRAKKVEERDTLEAKIAELEAKALRWKQKAIALGADDDDE